MKWMPCSDCVYFEGGGLQEQCFICRDEERLRSTVFYAKVRAAHEGVGTQCKPVAMHDPGFPAFGSWIKHMPQDCQQAHGIAKIMTNEEMLLYLNGGDQATRLMFALTEKWALLKSEDSSYYG